MSKPIEVITDRQEAMSAVNAVALGERNDLVMLELGGGIVTYAQVAFDGIGSSELLAKKVAREPEGRGPHFDAYFDILHPDYPYIGLFNLSGTASVRSTTLPAAMARAYEREFPAHTDDAYEARRRYGFVALSMADENVLEGTLGPRQGFVLPQSLSKEPIVHDVVPVDKNAPGEFVKFAVANPANEAATKLAEDGYLSLDEFLTQALNGIIVEPGKTRTVTKKVPARVPYPGRGRGSGRMD